MAFDLLGFSYIAVQCIINVVLMKMRNFINFYYARNQKLELTFEVISKIIAAVHKLCY